jgi:hypothetical protein
MTEMPRRWALGAAFAAPLLAAGVIMTNKAAAKPHGKDMATRLDELEARQQITDVLHLYARGWDRLDESLLRSCFHADSLHQHGGFKGLSQDFITKAFPMVAKVKNTTHAISNATIELAGSKAVSECYFAAHHRRMNSDNSDEEDYFLSGRYVDKFEKRDGVWKIAARRGLNTLERILPRADKTMASAAPESLSQRKPDDPLYALLEELKTGK